MNQENDDWCKLNLKVRHPLRVVKLTMCSMYVYVKAQLYLLVVY
jgi:hypothetical protein